MPFATLWDNAPPIEASLAGRLRLSKSTSFVEAAVFLWLERAESEREEVKPDDDVEFLIWNPRSESGSTAETKVWTECITRGAA